MPGLRGRGNRFAACGHVFGGDEIGGCPDKVRRDELFLRRNLDTRADNFAVGTPSLGGVFAMRHRGSPMAIYRLLEKEREITAFDPEAIQAMCAAFEEACDDLGLARKHDRITELVALKIIEIAKTGVRDAEMLRDMATRAVGLDIKHDPQ